MQNLKLIGSKSFEILVPPSMNDYMEFTVLDFMSAGAFHEDSRKRYHKKIPPKDTLALSFSDT